MAEKEFIEREAILKDYQTICNGVECARCPIRDKGHCKFEAYIHSIPAADVVPVVRCKDCEYWVTSEEAPCDTGCFLCGMYGGFPSADFFCASGERKDGDGDV